MKSKVLCVGLTCLDIVQVCQHYPLEDTDQRDSDCRLQRGGNASNNSTVLSLLGTPVAYLGTLASGPLCEFIKEDFLKYNIDIQNCREYAGYEVPLSTVLINAQNGSRTIIHSNKNLPEPCFDDFKNINLCDYTWVHFEGRNCMEVEKMINFLHEYNNENVHTPIRISVELEKPKTNLLNLVSIADVVFIGKDFSLAYGWADMKSAIHGIKGRLKEDAMLICTWGEQGAMALHFQEEFYTPSYPPLKVVDTLGAGDTFCAAAIHSLLRNECIQATIEFACRVAGFKVGINGYNDIRNYKV